MTSSWIFDPVLVNMGPLAVRWYGVMYALSFVLGYVWFRYSKFGKSLGLPNDQKDTLLIAMILGILLGGRFGYILFYNLSYYLANPLKILAVWEGGMSFHGGVLGVFAALTWSCKKYKVPFLKLSDLITSIAPLGIFLVRIGNFINGELYGRVATNFCLYFPADPTNCRYPSQLFQAFLEGMLLFLLLILIRKFTSKTGATTAFFLLFYGIFRIIAEFFREPDAQIGFLWGGITEGQLLSLFMVVAGGGLLWRLYRRREK
jgi:phosphatidylglycerol:prolipoprotein diacylglycerol transferase